MAPILILGGTAEARQLASILAPDYSTITSLAGRTQAPANLAGAVRSGGFGGVDGLVDYLRAERIGLLIDATHPYAARMGHHAAEAAARADVPILRLARSPWPRQPGDHWIEFTTVEALAEALPTLGQHCLVTLGGADLLALSRARGTKLTIRAIDPPAHMPDHPMVEVMLDRGPFDLQGECTLLSQRGIDVIASRNAGGDATYAKIEAARRLKIPVAMLARPARPDVETVTTLDAAVAWVKKCWVKESRVKERGSDL